MASNTSDAFQSGNETIATSTLSSEASSRNNPLVTETKGKNYEKNLRKKQNRGKFGDFASSGPSHSDLRFQVRMQNGSFTASLKDALLRDLHSSLFNLPSNSFVPTFKGHGLRFGVVWFAPDNEQSSAWLKETLGLINKSAGQHSFVIEPFNLIQVKVSLRIPWDSKECLSETNVLERLVKQNPIIEAHRWRVLKAADNTGGYRTILFGIDCGSLNLLEAQKFRLNYGFRKIIAKRIVKKTG